jgi:hypothetical protein
MSESDGYLATLYVEDRRGDRVWVTEQVCQDRPSGTRWMEAELNARRQAVAPGAQEGWHYVATFGEFPPPPMTIAYLRGPDTPIEWACSDAVRRASGGKWVEITVAPTASVPTDEQH